MYLINIHCKPTSENAEYFGKIKGGYASVYIDYKDLDGAFELAKFYVQEDFWEIIEVEEDYFEIDKKTEMGEGYEIYFDEVKEHGYSLIFNLYEEE